MARLLVGGITALVLLLGSAADAHKPSDSYLSLTVAERQVVGRWDIALRDLEHALGLDRNGDGAVTWGEVKAKNGDIAAYVLARLDLTSGAGCPTVPVDHMVDQHSDGAYAVLRFVAECPTRISTLDVCNQAGSTNRSRSMRLTLKGLERDASNFKALAGVPRQ